jgi:putative transposase
LKERRQIVTWMQEAVLSGARIKPACNEANISLRTYRRWISCGQICEDKRPLSVHPTPQNKLSDEEVAAILVTCNKPEYASLPPSQIVPRLADEGIYLASESTFYRVLKKNNQLQHRGRAKKPQLTKLPTTHICYSSSAALVMEYHLFTFLGKGTVLLSLSV